MHSNYWKAEQSIKPNTIYIRKYIKVAKVFQRCILITDKLYIKFFSNYQKRRVLNVLNVN